MEIGFTPVYFLQNLFTFQSCKAYHGEFHYFVLIQFIIS